MPLEGFSAKKDTDFELTLTPIYAERAFCVDGARKLRGISFHEYVYTDGLNESECTFKAALERAEKRAESAKDSPVADGNVGDNLARTIRALQLHALGGVISHNPRSWHASGRAIDYVRQFSHSSEHTIADCTCGFYAYFNKSNEVQRWHGDLHGIIEARGKTSVGTKGIRTEKTKILALYPTEARTSRWSIFERVFAPITKYLYPKTEWFLRHDVSSTAAGYAIMTLAMLFTIINSIASVAGANHAEGPWTYLVIALMWWAMGLGTRGFSAQLDHPESVLLLKTNMYKDKNTVLTRRTRGGGRFERTYGKKPIPKILEEVAKNYPSVKIFASREDALKEFPLSKAKDYA